MADTASPSWGIPPASKDSWTSLLVSVGLRCSDVMIFQIFVSAWTYGHRPSVKKHHRFD